MVSATGALPARDDELGAIEASLSAALTPAEHRTATLAADGLTNKQIAETLFVTVKAVEKHLGAVYAKLEIGSRREIAARLADDE
jgi:DNA-binding CsgD family transcriptional regulator